MRQAILQGMGALLKQLTKPRAPKRRDICKLHNVTLTGMCGWCTRCGKLKPASEFGLLRKANGEFYNQSQCTACRHLPPKKNEEP